MPLEQSISSGSAVGFLGPEQTFSHKLALEIFPDAELTPFAGFDKTFEALIEGRCQYALIPFFNNNGHDVLEAQIEIVRHKGKIFIQDLYCTDVAHCACGFGSLSEIKVVMSKQPVERQISGWLKKLVPGAKFQSTTSTAQAMLELSQSRDACTCAVGSAEAAKFYNVPIIDENIQNKPNRTLFLLLSTSCPAPHSVENAVLTLGPTTNGEMRQLIDIAESFECLIPAVSSFHVNGVKHAYFEINASYATLNLLSTVQQITEQFPNSTYLGGYSRKSILKLIDQP